VQDGGRRVSEDLTKLLVALIFVLLLILAITQIGLAEKLDNMKVDALQVKDNLVYLLQQIAEKQDATIDVIDLLADITGAKPEVK
jgi:hypothetical protein